MVKGISFMSVEAVCLVIVVLNKLAHASPTNLPQSLNTTKQLCEYAFNIHRHMTLTGQFFVDQLNGVKFHLISLYADLTATLLHMLHNHGYTKNIDGVWMFNVYSNKMKDFYGHLANEKNENVITDEYIIQSIFKVHEFVDFKFFEFTTSLMCEKCNHNGNFESEPKLKRCATTKEAKFTNVYNAYDDSISAKNYSGIKNENCSFLALTTLVDDNFNLFAELIKKNKTISSGQKLNDQNFTINRLYLNKVPTNAMFMAGLSKFQMTNKFWEVNTERLNYLFEQALDMMTLKNGLKSIRNFQTFFFDLMQIIVVQIIRKSLLNIQQLPEYMIQTGCSACLPNYNIYLKKLIIALNHIITFFCLQNSLLAEFLNILNQVSTKPKDSWEIWIEHLREKIQDIHNRLIDKQPSFSEGSSGLDSTKDEETLEHIQKFINIDANEIDLMSVKNPADNSLTTLNLFLVFIKQNEFFFGIDFKIIRTFLSPEDN